MRQNNGRHISWCKGISKIFQFVSKKFLIGVKMEKIDKIIVVVSLTGFACLMLIIGAWG